MTIDPDIQAFVADSEAFYPHDTASRSISERRRLYEAYAQAFALARSPGLLVQDAALMLTNRTIPLRRYAPTEAPPRATIVYAHGGGFMLGSLASHDGIVARLAARLGADVVAVEYRLAPEHPSPAGRDDVEAVVEAVSGGTLPWPDVAPAPLWLVGDSAGATLVAGVALRRAASLRIDGLGLIYPALGYEPTLPAAATEAEAPMLTLADVRFCRGILLGGSRPDPCTFPLDAPSLHGCPPTVMLAAEHDPLRDDCAAFARRVTDAGGDAHVIIGRGLVHGFLRALDRSHAAAQAFETWAQLIAHRLP